MEAAHTREVVRSEITRLFGVIRAFALRVGELAGLGDGVFFLYCDELIDILARRETHARYSALPPYPGLISGRFDPFQWAVDPHRRSDYFDARRARH